jgi:hypothetical protein
MGVCLIFKFLVQEGHYLTAVNSYNSTPSSYIYLYSLVIRGQNLHVNYTIILNFDDDIWGRRIKGEWYDKGELLLNCTKQCVANTEINFYELVNVVIEKIIRFREVNFMLLCLFFMLFFYSLLFVRLNFVSFTVFYSSNKRLVMYLFVLFQYLMCCLGLVKYSSFLHQ